MKHSTRIMMNGIAGLLVGSALLCGSASAQQPAKSGKTASKSVSAGRDPFRKFEPPRIVVAKSNLVSPPSIEERIAQYRLQKQAAMSARIQAPKPTVALLLTEMQVVGISRTPRGYAAIVEATPIKMSFVIYPGERFYDGQLVAIEDNRLVFRKETVYTDGRRERSVELKPLRQPSTVDVLASIKPAAAPVPAAADTAKNAEKPATAAAKP
jgi:hypothetical protein